MKRKLSPFVACSMLNVLGHTIEGMSLWLSAHATAAYAVLFFGSYFETLIGPGFFIYGEAFFLPAAILAGAGVLDIRLVAFWLILGGFLGDTSSYWIGRRFGTRFFKENNRVFNFINYQKGQEFFRKFGAKAIFFARLLGPLSWIMPFLSGTYKIPYQTFLLYNVPGVMVGIGEFLLIGYFFGNGYKRVLSVIQQDIALILFSVIGVFVLSYLFIRSRSDISSLKP